MSGFFWNIRGFNKFNKQQVVKNWIDKYGIEFGALLETRVKAGKSDRIVTSLFKNWSMVSNYEFHRLGRIWVIWSTKVKLRVVFKSAQMITCAIELEDGEDFFCSFIYASNFEEERRELWRDITQGQNSASLRGKPWLCCGDFNEILDIKEHSNFSISPTVTPGMRDFQAVVRCCSFTDLAHHGPQFTWTNKRDNDIICKKLDRMLVNDKWMQQKQHSYCVFDSGGCSDHLRGKLILQGQILKPRGPFKFTNVIAAMPEFKHQMETFWTQSEPLFHSTTALFRLSKKLKQLKPILRKLSRNKLHDISRRAAEAYENLCTCQINSLTNVDAQAAHAESMAYDRWEKISAIEENS
ncbi:hypothetical protein V5N11_033247 [Cardamine amara subsp. amara]|uniref:Endonuclease/exonuclease/phosphatase domain-containing protein n=1 Tax=Cardamine amara subsp. amara TaxID=228776 RepID=A0ABD1ACU3_CARAN